ncbi:MAG: TPM domain-containing protein [Planctomycetota bacterium]
MARSSNPAAFLSPEETRLVEAATKAAEAETSAEIKLVIVRHSWKDLLVKAEGVFQKLGLERTRDRNCVLILLVTTNREFLIYGDRGIHEKVGQNFWDDVRDVMAAAFRKDRFGDGLVEGIERMGRKLAQFFPRREDDTDEIPNEAAYEE